MSRPPANCAMRRTCAKIRITSAATHATLSEVAIPLHVGERVVGVFTASHPELDGFPSQQLRILQAFCDHVSVAVHNARGSRQNEPNVSRSIATPQEARSIQAGSAAQEFAICSRLCDFRAQRSRARCRRGLVRLHPLSQTGAGDSCWPMFREKERPPRC